MKAQFERSFYPSVLGAVAALLLTGTLAQAQTFHALDWSERFNDSAGTSDVQDNWVANSYTASSNGESIISITLPIGDTFTNKPVSALIYAGFDTMDPTAGGGLMLMGQKDTTFTSVQGTILTITFDNPVTLPASQIFYAAVLIPQVPPDHFPFYNDSHYVRSQSFFDIGLTFGGMYDIHQLPDNSANITPLGGNHPIDGPGIQSAGSLALWVNGM
jgi:hypothetical protein